MHVSDSTKQPINSGIASLGEPTWWLCVPKEMSLKWTNQSHHHGVSLNVTSPYRLIMLDRSYFQLPANKGKID